MSEVVASVLVLFGGAFMLVAALGVVRMPDLPMRMHAATKAGTLGAGLVLLAVAVVYADVGVTVRALATIAFLFLTAPVSAHVIGRAAAASGQLGLWHRTELDELAADLDAAAGRPTTADPAPVAASGAAAGAATSEAAASGSGRPPSA